MESVIFHFFLVMPLGSKHMQVCHFVFSIRYSKTHIDICAYVISSPRFDSRFYQNSPRDTTTPGKFMLKPLLGVYRTNNFIKEMNCVEWLRATQCSWRTQHQLNISEFTLYPHAVRSGKNGHDHILKILRAFEKDSGKRNKNEKKNWKKNEMKIMIQFHAKKMKNKKK